MSEEPFGKHWNDKGKELLLQASEDLIEKIRAHVQETLNGSDRPYHMAKIFDASDQLNAGARAYVDAVFEFTGAIGLLFDNLYETYESELDPEPQSATEPAASEKTISVFTRADYAIDSVDELIEEARAAYLSTWPNDEPIDAQMRVDDVRGAIYELTHKDSAQIDGLNRAASLRKLGRISWVVDTDEPLSQDDHEWPASPFDAAVDDEVNVIFSEHVMY
ncbi:hypothetical protein [Nonomuraea sediminis]|uniref:hypothetical protein n=1 Tax=Nonomuraea sediminis TaxID=2835864 RepID=UPI001BDDB835|nr:hypothetical protein [Nonomuraea sediminis]